MKKYRFIVITIAVVVAISTAIAYYIEVNKDELILVYMLYDHIQYNGHDYYRTGDQYHYPSEASEEGQEPFYQESKEQEPVYKESGERGPVYLVDKSSKVISQKTYNAYVISGYEGDENGILLFFDSAMWIRDGYATAKTALTHY